MCVNIANFHDQTNQGYLLHFEKASKSLSLNIEELINAGKQDEIDIKDLLKVVASFDTELSPAKHSARFEWQIIYRKSGREEQSGQFIKLKCPGH